MSAVRLNKDKFTELFKLVKGSMRWDSEGYGAAKYRDFLEGGGNKHVKEYLNPTKLPLVITLHSRVGDFGSDTETIDYYLA